MLTRCISGAVLVVIALVTILSGGYVLAGTLLAISCIAFYELSKVCGIRVCDENGQKKCNAMEVISYIAIIFLYVITVMTNDITALLFWLILFILAVLGVYVFTFPRFHASKIMADVFCVLYAPLMFSFLYRIREMEMGIYLVWMVFVCSWISDTFAYFTGMLLGRHKLAPVLSPKKSIEGSIGGIAGSALAGALFGYFCAGKVEQDVNLIVICAILGALGSVISQIGDLAASGIKRCYEIKDYGHLIPGHGGIMDRFDSVIVTAPIVYFLVYYLV